MTAYAYLMVLLTSISSLCLGSYYYVKPTEPKNTSCPDQPCLTLSQYINHSHVYFISNSVFKFLSGTHQMDKPIVIEDVSNMSFESQDSGNLVQPHVVAEFTCSTDISSECILFNREMELVQQCFHCPSIIFHNATNITLDGIHISVMTPQGSGVIFWNVSNLFIQFITISTFSTYTLEAKCGVVIDLIDLSEILSTMNKCPGALVFESTKNAKIVNTNIVFSYGHGIFLDGTTNTDISNTHVLSNGEYSLLVEESSNTTLSNRFLSYTVVHYGLSLSNTNNTRVSNTTIMCQSEAGEYCNSTSGTLIGNTTFVSNSGHGIIMSNTSNTDVSNTSSYGYGLHLSNATTTNITNVEAMNIDDDGIYARDSTYVNITNTTVMYSYEDGMFFLNTNNTYIVNTTIMHSNDRGLSFKNAFNVHIINATVMYNGFEGVLLDTTTNVFIHKTTVRYSIFDGISLKRTTSTDISDTLVMYNADNGVSLDGTSLTQIANTNVTWNCYNAVFMKNTVNSSITHVTVTAISEDFHGMYLENTTTTHISAINLLSAVDVGVAEFIFLETCKYNRFGYFKTTNGEVRFYTTLSGGLTIFTSTGIVIHNSSFTDIGDMAATSTVDPFSLPAVILLHRSAVEISECNFSRNNISAVKAFGSNVSVSGSVTFSSNTAIAGPAIIFAQSSVLKLTQNSHVYCTGNHAVNTGGVFHIITNEYYKDDVLGSVSSQTKCFIRVEGDRSQTKLSFVNNTAGKGGDVLFGGLVALGWDGDWNCLQSFKNISNISENGLSLISSDPSRVCLCNETGLPDCLTVNDPVVHDIYPGQSIYISVVVVGQDFGTVAGSVFAHFSRPLDANNPPQLESWQYTQGVSQHNCNHLKYTLFSQNKTSKTLLILSSADRQVSHILSNGEIEDTVSLWRAFNDKKALEIECQKTVNCFEPENLIFPRDIYGFPVHLKISFLPCPPGFLLTSVQPFTCDCNLLLQELHGVRCNIQAQTISRSGLVWVGTMEGDNGTVAVSEYCSLNYCKKGNSSVSLSDPDTQCNYNHSGTLCGGCQSGLSLALGTAQCLPCSNKYLALLIPFALAGVALVVFIKVLDLTVSEGTINGLIFYANIIKANEYIFLPLEHTHPLTLFIAWLNLDLGVETCFFHGLTAYTKTWLQFVFPLYVWGIAGLIIILAKYSNRVAKVMGNNSVPVLATLFLLSYAKLFRTIITSLSYTVLNSSQGPKAVWTADGNLEYLGPKHAPLFAVAAATLLFLWLPYTLLLFLGQWLHKCHCHLLTRMLIKLKPFMDAHYGPLKGNYHYWFGVLLLSRATILLLSALIPATNFNIVTFSISASALVLACVGQWVYQNCYISFFDASFLVNLALLSQANLFVTAAGGHPSIAAYTLIGIAFTQFLALVLFKLFCILKLGMRLRACLHKGEPAEGDWEHYEEAVALREMESDSEESAASGSVESLPTYGI